MNTYVYMYVCHWGSRWTVWKTRCACSLQVHHGKRARNTWRWLRGFGLSLRQISSCFSLLTSSFIHPADDASSVFNHLPSFFSLFLPTTRQLPTTISSVEELRAALSDLVSLDQSIQVAATCSFLLCQSFSLPLEIVCIYMCV